MFPRKPHAPPSEPRYEESRSGQAAGEAPKTTAQILKEAEDALDSPAAPKGDGDLTRNTCMHICRRTVCMQFF